MVFLLSKVFLLSPITRDSFRVLVAEITARFTVMAVTSLFRTPERGEVGGRGNGGAQEVVC